MLLPPPKPFPACPNVHTPTHLPYTYTTCLSSRPQLPLCTDTRVLGAAFSLECSVYIASFIALNAPPLPLSTQGVKVVCSSQWL